MPREPVTTRFWTMRCRSFGFVDAGACEGANVLTVKAAGSEALPMIKKDGAEFVVYDADGTTELGRHKTKALAQAQLAAVEANAAKRAILPGAGEWAESCKLAGATRPILDQAESAFWAVAQKAEEGCTPRTFDQVEDLAAVRDEMWKVWDRFRTSVNSIIESEADNKAELLTTSANEFTTFLADAAPKWADGKTAMKEAPMPTATKQGTEKKTGTDAAPTLSDEARKALPQEAQDYLAHLEGQKADPAAVETVTRADHDAAIAGKDAEIAALKKGATTDPAVDEAEALKSLPEGVRAMVLKSKADAAEANERAAEALKRAEAETERREESEAIKGAEAFKAIGKPEAIGPMLRRIESNKSTAEDHKELRRLLAASVAASAKIGLAIGEDAKPEAGSAAEQIETLAQKRVSEKGGSLAAARAQVRKENPELRRQERLETVH